MSNCIWSERAWFLCAMLQNYLNCFFLNNCVKGIERESYTGKLDMKDEKIELLRLLFRSKYDLSARCYISDGPFFLEDRR